MINIDNALQEVLSHFALFDSHLHIVDPAFPISPNQGYLPPSFTTDDYVKRLANYRLQGGAIVSGSFQGFDQSYLLAALKQLGDRYVGVTQIPATTTDEDILQLHNSGIRAVRFNFKRGSSASLRELDTLAHRVYELAGWHVELYIDGEQLSELADTLIALPLVSIDHLGMNSAAKKTLLKLAEKNVKVKATGFGRIDLDTTSTVQDIFSANPEALMFGTDLPSTRAKRPYRDEDFLLVVDTLGEQDAAKVLSLNAQSFYLR